MEVATPNMSAGDHFAHSVVPSKEQSHVVMQEITVKDTEIPSETQTTNGGTVQVKDELPEIKDEPVQGNEESPNINIAINNVVCTFSTRCHLNLKDIARRGDNVEFKKAQGMLNMKLRKPSGTASIWSSGKITVTGASSGDNSLIAARRIARILQKLGYTVKFSGYRIVNVLGTCSLPFGILINEFSRANPQTVQYEPELHPGATYTIKEPRATLKIFSTGSITVTAPKVENIQLAIEQVFPLVYEYKTAKRQSPEEIRYMKKMLEMSEFLDEDDDMILEPGEIPTTKTQRKQHLTNVTSRGDADDYGSSDDDDDISSDESLV